MKIYFTTPLILQKLIWIPTRLTLIIFGSLKVCGLENLKGIKRPIIFACNHSSEIDPFMVPASLSFFSRFSPLFYVVLDKSLYEGRGWRKHLFNTWFINMWGGYGVQIGIRDYEKSLAKQIEVLQEGGSFCIFPEGGITKDGEIQSAKGGISFLAHSAPCVIVPVSITSVYGMSVLDFFMRRRKISINFGLPIYPETLHTHIRQPHVLGESVWKKEADYIMEKVRDGMKI